jgi:hypothetical protein
MDITNFLWRFLPDRCSMPHCTRLGVRSNENIVDGRLMCDQCHAIHLLRRSVANEFAAIMERVEDALRELTLARPSMKKPPLDPDVADTAPSDVAAGIAERHQGAAIGQRDRVIERARPSRVIRQ